MEPDVSYTIGNRKKNPSGFHDQTVYSYTDVAYQHIHQTQYSYPDLADPITLTCGTASAWTLGTIVEIVPASTITDQYDIHWVDIGDISANGNYQINFYTGGSGSEVFWSSCRVTRDTFFSQNAQIRIQGPVIPANTRFSAAVASSTGDANTLTVSVEYHKYA